MTTAAPIAIDGTIPSAELRERLAAEGRPVLLAFSRGKDSIAAWLALRDAGVEVIPYHLHLIPGLEFVQESLAYFEHAFGTRIIDLPHPSLYRWLAHAMFQPPERIRTLQAAAIQVPSYQDIEDQIRGQLGLPGDTWTCDGVRAADSPNRRTSLLKHGPVNASRLTQKVIWDWRKAHVYDAIRDHGVQLPPEYEWFGRSFDGLDKRFLGPIREHRPADYARILQWFPHADLEFARGASLKALPREKTSNETFGDRAKREADRFRLATDSEYWISFCFRSPAARDAFTAAAGAASLYIPGAALPQEPGQPDPRPRALRLLAARSTRGLDIAAIMTAEPAPDPFAGIPVTGDVEADSAAELTALLAALGATPDPEPVLVLDSPHWAAVWWPHRQAKNEWLAKTGCDVLGDKYLDGHKAATILGGRFTCC